MSAAKDVLVALEKAAKTVEETRLVDWHADHGGLDGKERDDCAAALRELADALKDVNWKSVLRWPDEYDQVFEILPLMRLARLLQPEGAAPGDA